MMLVKQSLNYSLVLLIISDINMHLFGGNMGAKG